MGTGGSDGWCFDGASVFRHMAHHRYNQPPLLLRSGSISTRAARAANWQFGLKASRTLRAQGFSVCVEISQKKKGGQGWIRTSDFHLGKVALWPLSYSPSQIKIILHYIKKIVKCLSTNKSRKVKGESTKCFLKNIFPFTFILLPLYCLLWNHL